MAPVDRKPGSSVRRTRVPRMLPLMLTPSLLLLQASRPDYGDRQLRSNPPPVHRVKPEDRLQAIPSGGMLRFCSQAIKPWSQCDYLRFRRRRADLHAVVLPGRPPPGFRSSAITKRKIVDSSAHWDVPNYPPSCWGPGGEPYAASSSRILGLEGLVGGELFGDELLGALRCQAEGGERLGHRSALGEQPEEEVLGADVVVPEAQRRLEPGLERVLRALVE